MILSGLGLETPSPQSFDETLFQVQSALSQSERIPGLGPGPGLGLGPGPGPHQGNPIDGFGTKNQILQY